MIKIFFLFMAVWFTLINTARAINHNHLSAANFIIQAVSITGFIYLQFLA